MAGKKIEMIGRIFGKLKVLSFDRQNGKNVYWVCQCDCGILKAMDGQYIRNAASPSCGCERDKNKFKAKPEIHCILGQRRCCSCKEYKELNEENFYPDINKVGGFSYGCIKCSAQNGKKSYSNNPHETWSEDRKNKSRSVAKKYRESSRGRAVFMHKSYKKCDEYKGRLFDLTIEYVEDSILKPCVYCGDDDFMNIGLDRIDNNIGHTMDNCQPCCDECNVARSNHFTHLEMLQIGLVIKKIKQDRKISLQ